MICRACASTCPCKQSPTYKSESSYSPSSDPDIDSDFEPAKKHRKPPSKRQKPASKWQKPAAKRQQPAVKRRNPPVKRPSPPVKHQVKCKRIIIIDDSEDSDFV